MQLKDAVDSCGLPLAVQLVDHFVSPRTIRADDNGSQTLAHPKLKSSVLRHGHRVGQLFRFGLIGDVQAWKSVSKRLWNTTAMHAFCLTMNLDVGE